MTFLVVFALTLEAMYGRIFSFSRRKVIPCFRTTSLSTYSKKTNIKTRKIPVVGKWQIEKNVVLT